MRLKHQILLQMPLHNFIFNFSGKHYKVLPRLTRVSLLLFCTLYLMAFAEHTTSRECRVSGDREPMNCLHSAAS